MIRLPEYSLRATYLLGFLISLFFSFVALKNVVINPDGLCYVLSAEKFQMGSLKEAMGFCTQANWPFYAILLAVISPLLHLSLEQSAYLLNAIFDAGIIIVFMMVLRLLTTHPRIILLGLFTIVCAHDFNSVRDNIIRDHGYWLFQLLSLFFLLRYIKEQRLFFAINWAIALLVASLFRIEGLVFFGLLPAFLLFSEKNQLKRFFTLAAPLLLLLLIMPALYFFYGGFTERVAVSFYKMQHSLELIANQFSLIKNTLTSNILTQDSLRDATLVALLLLIVWYLITAMSQLSWVYTGLILFAGKIKLPIKKDHLIVLIGYLLVNLIITSAFFAIHLFLSKRYLMAQSFILMLFVPFAVNYIIENKTIPLRKSLLTIIFAWVLLANFHVIFWKKIPHYYLREAGSWIGQFIPANQSIFSNDEVVLYYANRNKNDLFKTMERYDNMAISHLPLEQFQYLAINTKKNNADKLLKMMRDQQAVLVNKFSNQKGQELLLYRRRDFSI